MNEKDLFHDRSMPRNFRQDMCQARELHVKSWGPSTPKKPPNLQSPSNSLRSPASAPEAAVDKSMRWLPQPGSPQIRNRHGVVERSMQWVPQRINPQLREPRVGVEKPTQGVPQRISPRLRQPRAVVENSVPSVPQRSSPQLREPRTLVDKPMQWVPERISPQPREPPVVTEKSMQFREPLAVHGSNSSRPPPPRPPPPKLPSRQYPTARASLPQVEEREEEVLPGFSMAVASTVAQEKCSSRESEMSPSFTPQLAPPSLEQRNNPGQPLSPDSLCDSPFRPATKETQTTMPLKSTQNYEVSQDD